MSGCMTTYVSLKERQKKKFQEKQSKIRQENQKLVFHQNLKSAKTPPNALVHTNEETKIRKKYMERKIKKFSSFKALKSENLSKSHCIIDQKEIFEKEN